VPIRINRSFFVFKDWNSLTSSLEFEITFGKKGASGKAINVAKDIPIAKYANESAE
jgi:hypothetical protein